MKIKCDDKVIYELEDWHKKVIMNDIPSEAFEADCARRLEWVLMHKFEQCFERFEKDWVEKLRNDPAVSMIPTDKKMFVDLVCARPDYKDRSARNKELLPG